MGESQKQAFQLSFNRFLRVPGELLVYGLIPGFSGSC